MDSKPKTHVLTVVYCEEGTEPCLAVAETASDGKKEILNIIHGVHATGIFNMLTTFQHFVCARGNSKSFRLHDMLNALNKFKDL